jgi:outer membrane protein
MKKALYILLFVGVSSAAMAQSGFMSWQYSVGFGTGDQSDYIGATSWRGVTYNYSKLVRDNVAVGLEIGWNAFYEEKPYDTYSRGNFDLSGKQWRYSNHVPLLFTVGYYHNPEEDIVPFVNFGIGTMYSERRVSMGQWEIYQDAWPFTVKPELGVMFNTGGMAFALSGKYYYGMKTGDLPAHGYFTVNLGFVFIN